MHEHGEDLAEGTLGSDFSPFSVHRSELASVRIMISIPADSISSSSS